MPVELTEDAEISPNFNAAKAASDSNGSVSIPSCVMPLRVCDVPVKICE